MMSMMSYSIQSGCPSLLKSVLSYLNPIWPTLLKAVHLFIAVVLLESYKNLLAWSQVQEFIFGLAKGV